MRDRAHIIMLLTAPFGEAAARAVDARLHLIAGFTFVTNNRTQPRAGLTPHVTNGEQRRKARVAGRYSGGTAVVSYRGAASSQLATAPPRERRLLVRVRVLVPAARFLDHGGLARPRTRRPARPHALAPLPSLAPRPRRPLLRVREPPPGPIRKPLALYLTECLLLMVCALRP